MAQAEIADTLADRDDQVVLVAVRTTGWPHFRAADKSRRMFAVRAFVRVLTVRLLLPGPGDNAHKRTNDVGKHE